MKIKTEQLVGGRIILHIKENDGSPIATREMNPQEVMGMFVHWYQSIVKESNQESLAIEIGDGNEMVMFIRKQLTTVEDMSIDLKTWADSFFAEPKIDDDTLELMKLWNNYCRTGNDKRKKFSLATFKQQLLYYFEHINKTVELEKKDGRTFLVFTKNKSK